MKTMKCLEILNLIESGDLSVDRYSQWYVERRTSLLTFWILGNLFCGVLAFYISWKLGAIWSVFTILAFIVGENLLMRRVDHAAPR